MPQFKSVRIPGNHADAHGPGPTLGIGASTAKRAPRRHVALHRWQLRRVAVMNSRLTVIDPAAPRRCNPIAIGANGDELRCGRGGDLDDWTRSDVANVLVALGEAGCRYRHASHARKGDRNSGERRMGHDISRPKVSMFGAIHLPPCPVCEHWTCDVGHRSRELFFCYQSAAGHSLPRGPGKGGCDRHEQRRHADAALPRHLLTRAALLSGEAMSRLRVSTS